MLQSQEGGQAPAVETKGGEHGQPREPSVGRKSEQLNTASKSREMRAKTLTI